MVWAHPCWAGRESLLADRQTDR
eukprot:COSAG01_NODE_71432_length_256_cov_0.503185_1_plen_22_part_10